MASIRGKNTKPETKIRKLVWSLGKRYRIHDRKIFGIPDISNKSKKWQSSLTDASGMVAPDAILNPSQT